MCLCRLFLGLLRSLVERCLERQLAHGEVFVFFAALTLLLALDWSWGGFSSGSFGCLAPGCGGQARRDGSNQHPRPVAGADPPAFGESTALVLLIVTASLLVGFLNKFSWGSYTALFLAWMFTVPGPVDEGTLQWLLVLMAAVWLARKVPGTGWMFWPGLYPAPNPSGSRIGAMMST